MFIIFSGLPGVGKSTIAKELSKKLRAVYLRIDTIEQAFKNAAKFNDQNNGTVVAEGYMAAYSIAKDNLINGLVVVADSVNPIELTRNDFRQVAIELNKPYLEIEVICSDKQQHQHRIETRRNEVEGLKLPTWQQVLDRDYEAWKINPLRIDTSVFSVSQSVDCVLDNLRSHFDHRN